MGYSSVYRTSRHNHMYVTIRYNLNKLFLYFTQLDLASFSSGLMHLIEWVPYVQAARDPVEQNMEATIDDVDHQLYFRVTRTVSANGELLIWYSDKLAARIGVPEIKDDFIRGNSIGFLNGFILPSW